MNEIVLKEIWKPIPEFEGLYEISNLGRVKSLVGWDGRKFIKREMIIKTFPRSSGYYYAILRKNRKVYTRSLHTLIAEVFIPNPNNYDVVNHIDLNKHNNDISNLEWCSKGWNIKHGHLFGETKSFVRNYRLYAEEYINTDKTTEEVARTFGVSQSTVVKAIKRCGVEAK